MDDDGLDVPLETLLGAEQVVDLFALFDAYPGLLGDLGLATLFYLAENAVLEAHRKRFSALHAVAEAVREHGRSALAREYDRIGVSLIHLEFNGYWPVLLTNLGATYANGEPGSASPAMERAINCFTHVLRILEPTDTIELWANATIGLGRAYLKRAEGDPRENAHRGLGLLLDVRDATSPTDAPLAFAEASAEFGTGAVNLLDDYNLAIRLYSEALAVYTPERHWGWWVRTQANLANAFLKRGADASDAEEAVKLLEAILACADAGMGPVPGSVLSRLGGAYLQRLHGSYAENRERAIACLTQALDLPADAEARATILTTLGVAWRDRVRGDRAANIERAIDCFERSLACQDQNVDPEGWVTTNSHLAHAYLFRLRGSRSANIETAMRCAGDAIELSRLSGLAPEARLDALNALASACLLNQGSDSGANIEQAIGLLEEAIALAANGNDALTRAKMLSNLGSAYASRLDGDADENCETAIRHFEAALRELDSCDVADPARARNLLNLGLALVNRRQGDRRANLARGAACFRAADESGAMLLGAAPRLRRHMAEAEAHLALGPASWKVAQARLDDAFGLFGEIWHEAITPEGRRELVATASQAGRWSALMDVAAGHHARGLERLEASRAIVLRETLALDEMQSWDIPPARRMAIVMARQKVIRLRSEAGSPAHAPDCYLGIVEALTAAEAALAEALDGVSRRIEPLDIDAVCAAIPPGAILIVPVATAFGSLVYVVPAGTAQLDARHVVNLPALTSDDVRQRLTAWLRVQQASWTRVASGGSAHAPDARWQMATDALDEALDWLGQTVMAPVFERIATLAPGRQPHAEPPELVIMPTGDFALFSFHAAICQHDGERRRVIEDYPVSYTPSLQALRVARLREARMTPGGQDLLALVNPTNDLPFSESVELPALRRLFPTANTDAIHVGATAAKAALRGGARGARYLHFACHGRFDDADPEQSGLKLAGDEWLTMREIAAEVELDGCRWVMLSACETGVTDVAQTPEEAAGLVAAFQMAGAPCVLASLWAVPDRSTALFVAKVYEEHLLSGLPPARALRRAALWLKELPADALEALLGPEDRNCGTTRFAEIGEETGAPDGIPASGARPFASPLFWAPFAVWGV